MARSAPKKRYGLFSLAILLLVLGATALFLGYHNFALWAVGLVAVMGSVRLVQASHVHAPSSPPVADGLEAPEKRRPSPMMWRVGIALLLLTVASYWYLLREDALHGGDDAFPLYLFAAVGLVCSVFWAHLLRKRFL